MGDTGQTCLTTVDGVDFQIQEPTPWSSAWCSHKFRSAGLRYEIAICIATGWIVHFNGPFECGSWPDRKIFKQKLKYRLEKHEKVVADRGYKYIREICNPDQGTVEQKIAMGKARARHETVNGRIKSWSSCRQIFRHSHHKHHLVLRSVMVIEQIKMQNGKPAFQIKPITDPVCYWD
jgi:hypothetical protein